MIEDLPLLLFLLALEVKYLALLAAVVRRVDILIIVALSFCFLLLVPENLIFSIMQFIAHVLVI